MEMRTLSIAFLVFYMTWTNADARKIGIFQNTGLWKLVIPGLRLKDTIHQKGEVLSFGSSFAFVCNACIEVSNHVEQFLSDPETLENVQTLASDICKIVPSDIRKKCNETLQANIQEPIEILQDYLSQEKLCISTGFCQANYNDELELKLSGSSKISSLVVRTDRTCDLCEQFMGEAVNYMSENKTKSKVLAVLHQTCSKLYGFNAKCITVVDYYAPLIFQVVETMKPKEFCQRINFCSGSSPISVKPQNTNYAIWQSTIDEIKTELKDPEKQMKLIQMLLAGCKQIPNYTKECKKLVVYVPLILMFALKSTSMNLALLVLNAM